MNSKNVDALADMKIDSLVGYLKGLHEQFQATVDSDPEYDGEIDEVIAVIENLLMITEDAEDLQDLEIHHAMSLLAHLQLLHTMMGQTDDTCCDEEGADFLIEEDEEVAKPAKKQPPKKKPKK